MTNRGFGPLRASSVHIYYGVLGANSDHEFDEADSDGNKIWSFRLDNATLWTGPTMLYSYGHVSTNTERHNSCDSLYAHYWTLEVFPYIHGSWQGYGDLYCSQNTSNDYHFDKVSNTEHYVKTGFTAC